MKKLAYISVGAIFSLVLSYSFITWADDNSSSTVQPQPTTTQPNVQSATIIGEISFLDPATGNLIVFDGKEKNTLKVDDQTKVLIDQKDGKMDQLKVGDEVEAVCNSEKVARYIVLTKVNSPTATANSNSTTGKPETAVTPLTNREGVTLPSKVDNKWMEKWKDQNHDKGKHKGKEKKNGHDDNEQEHDD